MGGRGGGSGRAHDKGTRLVAVRVRVWGRRCGHREGMVPGSGDDPGYVVNLHCVRSRDRSKARLVPIASWAYRYGLGQVEVEGEG